jgi:hypothetical protein
MSHYDSLITNRCRCKCICIMKLCSLHTQTRISGGTRGREHCATSSVSPYVSIQHGCWAVGIHHTYLNTEQKRNDMSWCSSESLKRNAESCHTVCAFSTIDAFKQNRSKPITLCNRTRRCTETFRPVWRDRYAMLAINTPQLTSQP